MHISYSIASMRELRDQQVRFSPRDKKLEQVAQAEKLLCEIEPDRVYTYEYVCYRLTHFRPESHLDVTFSGKDISHDLRLFVDDLSDAARMSVSSVGEKVVTIEELAERFNVSTKTISRWRRYGLISRRFVMDGRKRVGFLESAVNRFVDANTDKVRRGSQFSQLSAEEKSRIIERARRLARAGGSPAEVVRRVARKTNRSPETIRYTLKQFDSENRECAIFGDSQGPLRRDTKLKIWQQYANGVAVESLSRRFNRTRASIYRIIADIRAERIIELPLDCVESPDFAKAMRLPKFEKTILGELPVSDDPPKKVRLPSGLPPYLASLYEVPLLGRGQELHLFRKMNYLKYKAARLREKLGNDQTKIAPSKPAAAKNSLPKTGLPKSGLMDQIEQLYADSQATKNQIVRANLRLVVSIAKRHVGIGENFFELVSDGNMSLMRAVEKFDFSRGFKFSTYASWAVIKNFARTIPDEHKHRDRFRTSHDEMFTSTEDIRSDLVEQEMTESNRHTQVEKILNTLDEREQKIIISRFGLRGESERLTLKEVGAEMGVTKERIRQLEARALSKLRKAVEVEKIDYPG